MVVCLWHWVVHMYSTPRVASVWFRKVKAVSVGSPHWQIEAALR